MSTAAGPSGLLVVDKPGGVTSHDVVGQVRRLCRTRKVGHAGTLDPMATGVLVLGVGRMTRLLGHLMLTEKAYDATVRLGVATTTDDAEGEVLSQASAARLDRAQVEDAFAALVGHIEQVPSAVSAIKVDGERAYKRVRAGESVSLPARPVTIHEIVVHDVARPATPDDVLDVRVSVRCSSGTYIRALARDVGAALGVGGHLTALRRTAVGPATLADAVVLDALPVGTEVPLMHPGDAARRFFPTVTVGEGDARAVGYGRSLPLEVPAGGPVAVLDLDGALLALYEADGGMARPVAVLVG